MSKVMINGRIAGKPSAETGANYTKFEIPVLQNGGKEPILVETYGLHSFMKTLKAVVKTCVPFLIAAVLIWIILTSVGNLSAGSREEEKQHLEEALRRAAVSCYASEGYYPPSVEYITQHYGIQIDTENFRVFYDVFAENLMPQIDVMVLGNE